jgi:LmbE family N-acetylglucosaminyl deacetylase
MQAASAPRTLLIAAHPDDETIGAAIRISRTPDIEIVHVTDGAPLNPSDAFAAGFSNKEDYGATRREEAIRALALAGVPPAAITNLGFTDQQLSFELESLTLRILALIESFRPDVVLTHPYEGGHPDHDSVAFACHAAKRLYEQEVPASDIELVEFTSYHAENGGITAYEFLPSRDHKEHRYCLSPGERQLKLRMLREYQTQAKSLAPFMLPEVEPFRPAPQYDFRRAPHQGRVFYEYFDWGIDSVTWRDLAHDAERQLSNLIRRVA